MQNFVFNNKEEQAEINIFGDIGESWFDNSVSMQGILAQLKEIGNKPLVVNISSLGGDVNHAFVIHDLIKMHNAPVTVRIFGATASSGTVIAMASDNVEMSENALFLIHNVWTMAVGNAKELRETADELDMFDNRVVDIYQKKINKSGKNKKKSEIMKLMEEERWIDATEAISWGFVNQVIKDKRVIENSVRNKINQTEYLPKIEIMENTLLNKVASFLGIEPKEESEVVNALEVMKADQTAVIEAKAAEIDTLKNELQASAEKIAEIEATKDAEIQNKVSEVEAKQAEFEALQNKFNEMEVELNRFKAEKTIVQNAGDPALENSGKVEKTETQKALEVVKKNVKNQSRYYKPKN